VRSEVLAPTGLLRGVLRRVDGRPVVGAEVLVLSRRVQDDGDALVVGETAGFSANLPVGDYELRARAEDCRNEALPFSIVEGVACDLAIELHPGATVYGRVCNSSDHSVPGGVVVIKDAQSRALARVEADPWGKFEVPGLPAATLECSAEHPMFGTAREVLVVAAPGRNKCDLSLSTEHTLEGVLVAADGSGIENAFVVCTGSFLPTSGYSWMEMSVTSAGGVFTFESVPAGVELFFSATSQSYAIGTLSGIRVGDATTGAIRIEANALPGSCKIVGRVVDPDGRPFSGALQLIRAGSGNVPFCPVEAGRFEATVPHGQFRCRIGTRYTGELFDTTGQVQVDLGTLRLAVK
jgi:hypothetical protein